MRVTVIRCSAKAQVSVTDGPFAETKEVVGGFILVDGRRDGRSSSEIAAGIPLAKLGSIEVRPVMHDETLVLRTWHRGSHVETQPSGYD